MTPESFTGPALDAMHIAYDNAAHYTRNAMRKWAIMAATNSESKLVTVEHVRKAIAATGGMTLQELKEFVERDPSESPAKEQA